MVTSIISSDHLLRQKLSSLGLNYVGIRGNPKAPLCVCGEAPGENEDKLKLPFVGASGWLLDKMLEEVGFSKADCWFTNPYKARPPENDIKRIGELGVPLELFVDQFLEELRSFKPTIIITCGKTATNILCPETKPTIKNRSQEDKEGFGSWRGSLLVSPLLTWEHYVVPMYHPAFALRNYAEREICVLILDRAAEEIRKWKSNGHLDSLPKRELVVNPSYHDCVSFLKLCIESTKPISVDIELLHRKVPYTVALALTPTMAMSQSFWHYEISELVELWNLLDQILKTKQLIGQNFSSFDANWLRRLGFSVNLNNVHDTLIRHHILWPGLRHKLEFQCMQYTRQPYYKEEGHNWSLRQGIEKLMHYNALDAAVTYEVFEAQEVEFNERD